MIRWDNRYFWINKCSWLIKAMWPVTNDRITFFFSYPANFKPGSCERQITKNKNYKTPITQPPPKNLKAAIMVVT